jgi:AraC family transcriptional regulator
MEPRLEESKEKILVGKRMDMCFAELKTVELWRSFMPLRKLVPNPVSDVLYSVEVYRRNFFREYDERNLFQKWAAVEVADFSDVPEVFETQIVPKGLYAVFTHKGSYLKAPDTYHYIFHEWLPFSDFLLDDRPHFAMMGEKYKGDSEDSEEEIWIPIRKIQ